MQILIVLLVVVVLVLVAGFVWAWRNRAPKVVLPDEPCDSCGNWIRGPRCRISVQGEQHEDGIVGGWAMVAYFHPTNSCCPLNDPTSDVYDADHVHAK